MNYISSFRFSARLKGVGIVLIAATLGWALGIPFLLHTTSASALTSLSATASSSAPSVSTSYIIKFTTTNSIGFAGSASTTRITFDPESNAFDLSLIATATDIFISSSAGLTQVANSAACGAGTDEIYVSWVGITQPADFIEFSTCAGDIVPAGDITVNIANAHVTHPSGTGSYIVRVDGTMVDAGDTRVAIISSVTVSATVDTNLTFSISTVASSTVVNGDTTTMPSTATTIAFGTLSTGTSSIAAQQLSVTTNAAGGYSVTVTESQNLASPNGADIDAFKDGNAVVAPEAWTTPAGTIGNENTYGHMGVTSNDTTLPGGDLFGGSKYAGLTSTSTRTVMYHNGVADGLQQDVGLATVAYRVEISALQEAANDYSNQLIYVATPIF